MVTKLAVTMRPRPGSLRGDTEATSYPGVGLGIRGPGTDKPEPLIVVTVKLLETHSSHPQ